MCGLFEQQLTLFVDSCKNRLDFSIEDMKYYSCLPLCALDAIFSIGVNYNGVSRTLDRFCNAFHIPRSSENTTKVPVQTKQTTVRQVLDMLNETSPEELADIVSNHQRTSTKNGILKTAAFIQWLDILELYEIQTYQDFHKKWTDSNLERDLRTVRGQKSGISTDYFYMLAGNTNDVKVDRHIMAFACSSTGDDHMSAIVIKDLFKSAVKELLPDHPGLTVRHLDHIIWEYQRNTKK